MITKDDALTLRHGTTLYHVEEKGSDNRPIRCRVNGQCKTWKTKPGRFRLPVKYGLRECFYITEMNAVDWRKEEDEVI
jgi:hypothetical protein